MIYVKMSYIGVDWWKLYKPTPISFLQPFLKQFFFFEIESIAKTKGCYLEHLIGYGDLDCFIEKQFGGLLYYHDG